MCLGPEGGTQMAHAAHCPADRGRWLERACLCIGCGRAEAEARPRMSSGFYAGGTNV